ncbi:DUF4215 domain-containing protein, partial [Candidatus Peregrinibacteria bacterium]|nr:DUF4215 domain-containing protein [Candidatus Peregrinibacteria bacterium]
DIYKDHLIIRTDVADLNLTTTDLQTADDVDDSDLDAIYTMASTQLVMGPNTELYIWQGTTHTTSGAIQAHDVQVVGTLRVGAHTLAASGSLVSTGTLVTTGDIILQAVSSGETLTVTGSSLNNLYFDNGITAYWKFDEGTGLNATGSTLSTQTGGSLMSGARWTTASTGNTLFFNPFALELDGTDDYVLLNDSYDMVGLAARTFAGWFRRKSSTTEDMILAKRSGTGASDTGYSLFIDDADDKLYFEVSDGTNEYLLGSQSSFTDQNWHHFAVTWNFRTQSGAQMYIDGESQLESRTGTFENLETVTNAVSFTVGANGSATSPFIGSLDDVRIYSRVLTGSEIRFLAAGNKDTGSGKYTLGSRLDVNGNYGVYSGRMSVNNNRNYAMLLGSGVSIHGTLLTQSGTVTLDGSNQTLRGSTAFRNLVKTSTTAKTITFESNSQQTFSGSIVIHGAVNNLISIRETRTGSQAYLVLDGSGSQTLKYLDVKDNNAMSGVTLICTQGCIDSENNINWQFLGVCGDGVKNTGEACDDGNTSNTDSCLNTCVASSCGDTFVNAQSEQCEPPSVGLCLANCFFRGGGGGGGTTGSTGGATSSGGYYKRPPPPQGCGNAIFEPDKGEECDMGERFNGNGSCSYDCKKLFCGDGVISPQIGEDCEPEVESVSGDTTTYRVATCGETCTPPEGEKVLKAVQGGCKRVFLKPCGGTEEDEEITISTGKAICGNGRVEGSEQCDAGGSCQGGQFDGSFWTDEASATTCMDSGGTPKPESGDGCSQFCKNEFCGDGSIQERGKDNVAGNDDDEQCDNGSICEGDASRTCSVNADCGTNATCVYNRASNTRCSTTCKLSVCGNGQQEPGETCDDSNTDGGDGCSSKCRIEVAARIPACGDGIRDSGETCDDGNTDSGDGCDSSCTKEPVCGNGEVESGEECDNGDRNSDTNPDACRSQCKKSRCGDGVQDNNEQCDGGQSCTESCTVIEEPAEVPAPQRRIPWCGDGYVEGREECDDANMYAGDGCNDRCELELLVMAAVCGNGAKEGDEECDDGNQTPGDLCSADCRIEAAPEPPKEEPKVPEVKQAAPEQERLDADVVVVNPTEIANALKFVDNTNPCALMVRKGVDTDAVAIRRLAAIQGIPIVENIPLARTLYDRIRVGDSVAGILCEQVNALREPVKTKPVEQKPANEPKPVKPIQPPPSRPTMTAYGFYNYAAIQPLITNKPAAGETGPGIFAVVASGAAGGWAWTRRKRRHM